MRYLPVLLLLLACPAAAGWLTVTDTRELALAGDGIDRLEIRSGHGFVVVRGDAERADIRVRADLSIPARGQDKASDIEAKYLELSLTESAGTATLVGLFRDYTVWRGDEPSVRLTVEVPKHMDVVIDDGTGYIEVSDLDGNLTIDDGSGSIDLDNIGGTVSIRDGSGWIDVDRVAADVMIEDRSGAISVSRVGANVIIDDGSGWVNVRDVSGDLTLVDNASGRFTFSGIDGVIRDES